MIFPVCHGRRVLSIAGQIQPCGECGSMGEVHCCEGIIATAEAYEIACERHHLAAGKAQPVGHSLPFFEEQSQRRA
jgi:hypothetical protein